MGKDDGCQSFRGGEGKKEFNGRGKDSSQKTFDLGQDEGLDQGGKLRGKRFGQGLAFLRDRPHSTGASTR